MSAAHTPGPWLIGAETPMRPTFTIYNKPFGLGDVAEVYSDADANLIAAAPDLLDALVRLLKNDDEFLTAQGLRNLAKAAIAKATGESS